LLVKNTNKGEGSWYFRGLKAFTLFRQGLHKGKVVITI